MAKPIVSAAAGLVGLLVLALGAAGVWLGGTQAGLDWLLAQSLTAGGALEVEGARGSLAGGMRFERITFSGEGARIEARDVSGRLAILSLIAGAVRIEGLRIAAVEVTLSEAKPDAPPPAPARLALPLAVRIYDASVGELRVRRAADVYSASELRLSYTGGPAGHSLRDASAQTQWGRLALAATMDAAPPFLLEVRATLEHEAAPVSAFARLRPFDEMRIEALEASTQGLDLARLDPALPRTSLKGRLEGGATSGSAFAGTLSVSNAAAGPLDAGRLPATSLTARFELQGGEAIVRALEASAAGGAIRGKGRLAPGRAHLELRLARIDLRALRSSLRETRLAGEIVLALAPDRQSAQGKLSQDGMQLAFDAARSGDNVRVRSFRAQAEGGVAEGSGELRFGKTMAARGKLRFHGFDPSRFGSYPEGLLNGRAELSGSLGEPRRLSASWSVADSRLLGKALQSQGAAQLAGERIHGLDAHVNWGGDRLQARGDFGAPGDEMRWTLSVAELPFAGLSGPVHAQGSARGGLHEHSLALSAKAKGLTLDARLRGGWLGGGWKGDLAQLRLEGPYPLTLMAATPLELGAQRVSAGELLARVGEGRLHVRTLDWIPGRLSTRGQFSGFPAAWLIAPAGLAEALHSTLLLDGEWSLESTPGLTGHLNVRRAAGDLTVRQPVALQLGLRDATIAATFDQGAVSFGLDAESRLGGLHGRGSAAALARDAAIEWQAKIELADIRAVAGALPAHVRIAGRAAAALEGRGTLNAPQLAGRIDADGLSVHYPPFGVYLDEGRLRGSLEGNALRVEELSLRGGDGEFTAHGLLPLLEPGDATLRWTAKALRLLGRPDMRLVVSGEGSAGIEERRVALQGRLRIDQGYIERALRPLPTLDNDIVVLGRDGGEAATPSRARARPPLDLDLFVDLGERFKVRGEGFDGLLKGELHVATVAGSELRAFGRIRADQATFRAYGQNLQVDPGIVIFNGPIDNPALQISAWRRNQQVAAGVRITGNLRNPRAELVSEPPLPEGAKLSWLVLGRAPSEASGADLALLQTAASVLLARGDSVPITTRIADKAGLDEIALRSSSEIGERVAAFGKRLSDRLYLTYEQGLGAAAQSLVKIDFSLTERVSLRAQTGATSGAGVYYRYSWD